MSFCNNPTQSKANDMALVHSNLYYIYEVYSKYEQNPSSVSDEWKSFFANNPEVVADIRQDLAHRSVSVIGNSNEFVSVPFNEIALQEQQKQKAIDDVKKALKDKNIAAAVSFTPSQQPQVKAQDSKAIEDYITELYSKYAHLEIAFDPLGLKPSVGSSIIKGLRVSYPEVCARLDKIYCDKIGFDFAYINSETETNWLKAKAAEIQSASFTKEERLQFLREISQAEMFEHQIHLKFPGAKRFSVEGGETLIPALEEILAVSVKNGIKESVIGMAHRGRLNVLTHTMGKPAKAIFAEFAGGDYLPADFSGSGDVKYHMGYSKDRNIRGLGNIHLTLTPNPSHLEAVNPVVAGRARAKQDLNGDTQTRKSVLPILIHGDAAMVGQGVVYESFVMSSIAGYYVGGTVHISIDNQVGFTASTRDTRGGNYSTDVAKVVGAPVLHVNSIDAESVIKAARLAAEYRATFGKDIVIDLICYRKYGHNEGDEPMFTQPVMYNVIKNFPNPHEVYSKNLIEKNIILSADYETIKTDIKAYLDKAFDEAKSYRKEKTDWLEGVWSKIKPVKDGYEICNFKDTKITAKAFSELGGVISKVEGNSFNVNKKVQKVLDDRKETVAKGKGIDWATAELLAYSSLVSEGHSVRLSGEDCERGTFSHRHSVLYNQDDNKPYNLLSPVNNDKAKYEVYNSFLSEFAVLGFEYGYSFSNPNTLTIWEAQFGDFSNGAVTIYDQFISSGEDKWSRMSGLVNLLPHGFEGQGPEHSSARLERFLQYCAQNNMIVANLTTPANLFHALRRQVKSSFRKPLIIMSPKSLLRHPLVKSNIEDFTNEGFKTIIGDATTDAKKVENIIITSGKFYYELLDKKPDNTAIIRIEQYYPFDSVLLKKELSKYSGIKSITWAQEEPKNMGAWTFIRDYLEEAFDGKVKCVARSASPSPATGYLKFHNKEQEKLIKQVFSA